MGRQEAELTTLPWSEYTHPDDLKIDLDLFAKFKAHEISSYSLKKRFIRADGEIVWVNMTIAPLQLGDEPWEKQNHLCLIENITTQINSQKALQESEQSKTVLLSNIPGMAYKCKIDKDWTLEFVSDGCFELTGYKPESLLYNKEVSFNNIIAIEYRDIVRKEVQRLVSQKSKYRFEYEIVTANNARKWVMELGQAIFNEKDTPEALEGILIDITEQKRRELQILYMNEHDYMTGLFNRKHFEEEMQKLNGQEHRPVSAIMTDINGLRLINDGVGYMEGDRLIKETAKILKRFCRKGDILARVGGDEFGFLLPNTDSKTAFELIQRIKNSCEAYNKKFKSKIFEINLSFGCSTGQSGESTVEDIVKQADEHMRNSKLLNSKSFHSEIISSMLAAVYAKSQETEEHAKRLAELSKKIGARLFLPQKKLDELELFAMLHDIGKIGIDDSVLKKPGKLNDEEWVIMKKHPEIGYRIAKSASELEPIAEYILTHHEKWNGKGYPKGLKGEEIHLLSRILAVVDAYDAMTEDRVYRKAMSKEEAIMEILANAGEQFDPEIAKIFIGII